MKVSHAKITLNSFFAVRRHLVYASVPQFRLSTAQLDGMLQRIRSAKAVEKNKFSRITPTNAAEFGERSITFLLSQEEVDDIIAVLKVMIEESQPNPAHIRVMLDVRDLRFIDELIVLLRSL